MSSALVPGAKHAVGALQYQVLLELPKQYSWGIQGYTSWSLGVCRNALGDAQGTMWFCVTGDAQGTMWVLGHLCESHLF